MQVEDDRDGGESGLADIQTPTAQRKSAGGGGRLRLATLAARLTGLESDFGALKATISIIETRLTGIENLQRHAQGRREKMETRISDFEFGVNRVQYDMATLKDRMRCVELDLRELSGTVGTGSRQGSDGPGSLRRSVRRPAGFKSS